MTITPNLINIPVIEYTRGNLGFIQNDILPIRINYIQPDTKYTFNSYICVWTLEKVRSTLSLLIAAYPNK